MNRQLAGAVRRLADQSSAQLENLPSLRAFVATVSDVVAAGSPGGNALVTVSWRGSDLVANAYHASYAPTIGDTVECHLIDSQLIVADKLAS